MGPPTARGPDGVCVPPKGLEPSQRPPPRSTAATSRDARARRTAAVAGVPQGRFFLELFAGSGAVSAALWRRGARVAVPIDVRHGRHHDLACPRVQAVVLSWLLSGRVAGIFMAPPCTPWSTARTAGRPPPVADKGFACARFARRVVMACAGKNVPFIIENPHSSRLWRWGPMRTALQRAGATECMTHLYAFVAAWVKPTCVAESCSSLSSLARRCPGHPEHVRLEGKVYFSDGASAFRTSFAAHYPPAFADAVPAVLVDSGGNKTKRDTGEPRLYTWWEEQLADGARVAPPPRFLAATAPARTARLGWEHGTRRWLGRPVDRVIYILDSIKAANQRAAGEDLAGRPTPPFPRRRAAREAPENGGDARHLAALQSRSRELRDLVSRKATAAEHDVRPQRRPGRLRRGPL